MAFLVKDQTDIMYRAGIFSFAEGLFAPISLAFCTFEVCNCIDISVR